MFTYSVNEKNSTIETAKEEAKLVMKTGNINYDWMLITMVVADDKWSQWSYMKNYNTLPGVIS